MYYNNDNGPKRPFREPYVEILGKNRLQRKPTSKEEDDFKETKARIPPQRRASWKGFLLYHYLVMKGMNEYGRGKKGELRL